jgi:protein-disulfide isomerase
MDSSGSIPTPSNHTDQGGVLIGSDNAGQRLVLFEDPQCPYCRQFEEACGDLVRTEVAAGNVAVEYRMRCFLGDESVRADNALALAAEADQFDQLRQEMFASQPPESSGGFTIADLTDLGRRVGLTGPDYLAGLHERRYEPWVVQMDRLYQEQDQQGTPAAIFGGRMVDSRVLLQPELFAELLRS